jgi:hypothetical protein
MVVAVGPGSAGIVRPPQRTSSRIMSIVEHTPQRLVVQLGSLFPHNSTCVFDKTTGRAQFERQLFFYTRKTIDVALDDIADFEVVEVGKPLDSYDPRVVLASGKRFYLSPAATREETRAVAQAVRGFLGLGP